MSWQKEKAEAIVRSHVKLLGVKINSISSTALNDIVGQIIANANKEIILHVNIHGLNLAQRHVWLKNLFNQCPIVFCDGDGVRLAAKLKGFTIVEKITYNRWIWQLAQYSEGRGFSWYMVGSKDLVIRKAVDVLKSRYPKLNIRGCHHGYLQESNIKSVIAEINRLKPNILILGMGMPIQEKFLYDHFSQLNINVALTGGAVFDYVSGEAKMTPEIFFNLKMEWFYRFLQEPKRLFKRYFIGNPLFFIRLLLEITHLKKF